MEKQRLFVDMDGTLAVFKPVKIEIDTYEGKDRAKEKIYEVLRQDGYYRNLTPIQKVVNAIKDIIKNNDNIEVFVLSAVIPDCPALKDKNEWLDDVIPEIDNEHRIFVPDGADKKQYIPDGLRQTDCLLDDYTHNLTLWQPPAKGIKLLNGINHTNETWKGSRLSYTKKPAELAQDISNIMFKNEKIIDEKPQAVENWMKGNKTKSKVNGKDFNASLEDVMKKKDNGDR